MLVFLSGIENKVVFAHAIVAFTSICEMFEVMIEWFSVECRKTKTKVMTLANHKEHTIQ